MLIQDADLEYDPDEYPKLIQPIVDGHADVVFGSRFEGYPRRVMLYWHRLGNNLLTFLSNCTTNLDLTDMETCYKVFRREVIQSINLKSNRFGIEPEITAKVARRGYRIFEVPISYYGRDYWEGKKINWKDGFSAIWTIFSYGLFDDPSNEPADVQDAAPPRLAEALQPMDLGARGAVRRPARARSGRRLGDDDAIPLRPRADRGHGQGDAVHRPPAQRVPPPAGHASSSGSISIATTRSTWRSYDFDTILCINVLEHTADDAAALRRANQLLMPGGRIIIFVPAGKDLFGTLDRGIGHQRRYERDELIAMLQAGRLRSRRRRLPEPRRETGVVAELESLQTQRACPPRSRKFSIASFRC